MIVKTTMLDERWMNPDNNAGYFQTLRLDKLGAVTKIDRLSERCTWYNIESTLDLRFIRVQYEVLQVSHTVQRF